MIYTNLHIRIYFGDARDALYPALPPSRPWLPCNALLETPSLAHLKDGLVIESLVVANQVHGIDGIRVHKEDPTTLHSFVRDADFLITHERGIGLGVLTADCVPIIMHDTKNNVIAAVHAGWRGSSQGVSLKALDALRYAYGTKEEHVVVYIGPSAGGCCYQVDEPFIEAFAHQQGFEKALHKNDKGWYFDGAFFNRVQMELAGIPHHAINMQHHTCTICSSRFFSYRRQKEKAGRQVSIISLI